MEPRHVPVLLGEVADLLDPKPGEIWVDATVGGGGHTRLIAERVAPTGRVLGLDQDENMLQLAQERLTGLPVELVHANFDQLPAILADKGFKLVDGVFADLGVCSDQLDDPNRGLSFRQDGPLDMRLDPSIGESAADLVNRLSEQALADLIWEYGEERYSRRIARRIVETREREPIRTTTQLAELIAKAIPGRRERIDPATRTFQALRIAVNDEMAVLDRLLEALPGCIRPGGRAGVISFHSLEDRRVKNAFRERERWRGLTKKPITAGEDEIARNSRARSAKLRVARRHDDSGGHTG